MADIVRENEIVIDLYWEGAGLVVDAPRPCARCVGAAIEGLNVIIHGPWVGMNGVCGRVTNYKAS